VEIVDDAVSPRFQSDEQDLERIRIVIVHSNDLRLSLLRRMVCQKICTTALSYELTLKSLLKAEEKKSHLEASMAR
jgi:hypothetical protein